MLGQKKKWFVSQAPPRSFSMARFVLEKFEIKFLFTKNRSNVRSTVVRDDFVFPLFFLPLSSKHLKLSFLAKPLTSLFSSSCRRHAVTVYIRLCRSINNNVFFFRYSIIIHTFHFRLAHQNGRKAA